MNFGFVWSLDACCNGWESFKNREGEGLFN